MTITLYNSYISISKYTFGYTLSKFTPFNIETNFKYVIFRRYQVERKYIFASFYYRNTHLQTLILVVSMHEIDS